VTQKNTVSSCRAGAGVLSVIPARFKQAMLMSFYKASAITKALLEVI
jgi:hypothetical protein